jgi:hypothetical protein
MQGPPPIRLNESRMQNIKSHTTINGIHVCVSNIFFFLCYAWKLPTVKDKHQKIKNAYTCILDANVCERKR